jgi:SAM-dependent methyltransferase
LTHQFIVFGAGRKCWAQPLLLHFKEESVENLRQEYYRAYENRYRSVYTQGVRYWTGDPVEIRKTTDAVKDFLTFYRFTPENARIVEFGCGEGHIAAFLIEKGYRYLGIDLASSALKKARERITGLPVADPFRQDDITHLGTFPDQSFTVTLDNFCLHMLVVDQDRQRYLSEVARLLTRDGKAFFHVNFQPEPFQETIESFEDYQNRFQPDLETPHERKAYNDGEIRSVWLPLLAARSNNESGYREELAGAGLHIEHFKLEGHTCLFYAGKTR